MKFANKEGGMDFVWGTSWGVSTRLIGGLIMAHSDDFGLVLPPKLAPIQVVIVPIIKEKEQLNTIAERLDPIIKELQSKGVSVKLDDRDTHKPGWKFAEYELKGVPVRLAMGPRDLENGTVEIARRDTLEKQVISLDEVVTRIEFLLKDIQDNIYQKALDYRTSMTTEVSTYDEFKKVLDEKGGFIKAHWDGTAETEEKIKEETKATIRCILLDEKEESGKCIYSGKDSKKKVVFARAY